MPSLAPPSALNCCAAGTTCPWPTALPGWLRRGLRAYGGRFREQDLRPVPDPHRDSGGVSSATVQDPGSDPVTARNRGARYPALGGDQHDAEVAGGRGRSVTHSGLNFEAPAANVAEYCDIPLATLHMFPMRANGQFLPFLPAPLCALRHDGVAQRQPFCGLPSFGSSVTSPSPRGASLLRGLWRRATARRRPALPWSPGPAPPAGRCSR